MKKRLTEEQIIGNLKQAETEMKVAPLDNLSDPDAGNIVNVGVFRQGPAFASLGQCACDLTDPIF
ncbi:hypothetical protein G3I67_14760 [Orrella sp. NBD-18]|uniref:Uncharacterized protein n=1 Tax=Sheuella amnicola TaxID=2707330 RepID=A0A6B2R2Z9_9BURK|nr:hypothetical protein [Sheuella amnicola]NDY84483.1 hypothetical protein [Sheuella amnicola]